MDRRSLEDPDRSALPALAVSAGFLASVQVLALGTGVLGLPLGRLPAIGVLGLSALLGLALARRFRAGAPAPTPSAPGGRPAIALVAAALGWCGAVWIALAILAWHRPVLDWDGLVYHVPAMHAWALQGHVGFIRTVPDIPFVNYPMGAELTGFVLHRALGTSRLVDAHNLLYWPLALAALAVLAERLGARGPWKWLAGAALFGVPTFLGQSVTAYVDAAFAATVMASVAAVCVFVSPGPHPRGATTVLLGLALGLMLGTKGFGLPFLLIALGGTAVGLLLARSSRDWAPSGGGLLLALLLALAVGGYWYVRNAVVTENPVYPIRFALGHAQLARGWDPSGFEEPLLPVFLRGVRPGLRPFVSWLQPDAPVHGPISTGGLGWVWLFGCVPACLLLWIDAARRRERAVLGVLALVTGLVTAATLALPYAWESRYVLFLHALGLPCLAAVLARAAAGLRARRGHAVTLVAGCVVLAVAARESRETLALEWETGRPLDAGARRTFLSTAEYYFPGIESDPGFTEVSRAARIGRGRWASHPGTLLGGVLALPLGVREIRVVPPLQDVRDPVAEARLRRPPTDEEIAALRDAGIEWFVWESSGEDDLPASLSGAARDRSAYLATADVTFHFLRLR